jgi:ABC-2 type transport system ATP-binding protein
MKIVRPHVVLNVGVAGDRDAAAKLLETHQLVGRVDAGEKHLTVTLLDGHHDYSDLATLLVTSGHKLTLFREEELNLETAFMALTKGLTS